MPIRLTVTVLTVDNHDQEEFLHLVHEVAIAIRWLADNDDVTDEQRARVRDWLQALKNHAAEDLKDRPDALELIRQAAEADFLRINLTHPPEEGDEATPTPDDV